jgi:hypothetical protein
MNDHNEVVNKCSETYLRCFSPERKNQWAQWLPLAKWWYNKSYHTTNCMTPFEAVYGQNPQSVLSYMRVGNQIFMSFHRYLKQNF